MTTISTTAIGPPLEAEGTAAGGSRGLVAVGVVAALAAIALAASCLSESDLEVGGWVRSALVLVWALAAIVLALRGAPALGVVVAGAAVVGGICAATAFSADLAEVHMIAAALVPAVALHLELVLPDGLFGRSSRRNLAVAGYVVAGATGVALALAGREPAAVVVAAAVVGMLLVGLPSAHQTYQGSAGLARQRLQLVGCAVAVIAEVALVVAALRILVDWPDHAAEVAAGATALVPLALAAGTSTRVARRVDRLLVHTVSATGLTAVVVLVYLVIVIGLGRAPADSERTLLVLSMLAAAVAALAYVPARERLAETANRLVYGERHPPDEVLRTWGSRLSRSIPMDELLLQLAESLRKVLVLRRAEIWTGSGGRLELAVVRPGSVGPSARARPGGAARGHPGGCDRERLAGGVAPRPAGGPQPGAAPRRAGLPLRGAARAPRDRARRRRRPLHRGGRPGADRAGPPGRPRAPQRAARLRAPGEPREPEASQRRPAGLACPHRGLRRRRAPQDRAQPARRGPAAPRRPGREPPPHQGHARRRPGVRGRDARRARRTR